MSNAGSNLPPHEAVAAAFAAGTNALKALREFDRLQRGGFGHCLRFGTQRNR